MTKIASLTHPGILLESRAHRRTIGQDAHAKLRQLLYLTVACGLVHVNSQFYFLLHMSATSLALSNLAVQATPVRFLDHLIGIAASSRLDRRFISRRL